MIGQPLTLAAARRLASDVSRERAMGRDVVADRKAEKARMRRQHQERSANTFGSRARLRREPRQAEDPKLARRPRGCLASSPTGEVIRGSLADRWADRPVADIDGHDVYAVTEEARTRGVPGWGMKKDGPSDSRARHLFSALSTMFTWLHRHRRVETNPCAGVHRPEPGRGIGSSPMPRS